MRIIFGSIMLCVMLSGPSQSTAGVEMDSDDESTLLDPVMELNLLCPGSTEFHNACKARGLNKVKEWLEKDPNLLYAQDDMGRTGYFYALWGRATDVVDYFD